MSLGRHVGQQPTPSAIIKRCLDRGRSDRHASSERIIDRTNCLSHGVRNTTTYEIRSDPSFKQCGTFCGVTLDRIMPRYQLVKKAMKTPMLRGQGALLPAQPVLSMKVTDQPISPFEGCQYSHPPSMRHHVIPTGDEAILSSNTIRSRH